MKCKKCGQEVDKKAVVCTGCGCKISKPIFKKWWFWVIIAIIVIAVASSGSNSDTTVEGDESKTVSAETIGGKNKNDTKTEETVYETVDLQILFDDLEGNAMKAESKYNNKNVEFECKIVSFDSDGKYISVEPVNADEWNFTTAMCYIKNDTQRDFLIEKNAGDIITVKGKVKSIGEVLGYSFDIKEVY